MYQYYSTLNLCNAVSQCPSDIKFKMEPCYLSLEWILLVVEDINLLTICFGDEITIKKFAGPKGLFVL